MWASWSEISLALEHEDGHVGTIDRLQTSSPLKLLEASKTCRAASAGGVDQEHSAGPST